MILRGEIKNTTYEKILIEHTNGKLEILIDTIPDIKKEFKTEERIVVEIPDDLQNISCSTEAELTTIRYTPDIRIEKDPFRYISDLKREKYSTVMAVCTSFRPLTSTKGTDSLFSLNIKDHTGSIELKVFIKEDEYYRFIEEYNNSNPYKPGDVLVLRSIKKSNNENIAVIAKPCVINRVDDSIVQQLIMKQLDAIYGSKMQGPVLNARKMKMIKDLNDRCFFDILGKVIYINDTEKIPAVIITDYTKNLYVEECASTFPNNMVLIIKLFGHHSLMIEKIKLEEYYIFKNIRTHLEKNVLEAYMHDYLDGDIIRIEDQSILEEIKKREEIYHKQNRTADRCNTREKEVGIEFAEIREMNHSGVYLCRCMIVDVAVTDTGFYKVEIVEIGRTYTMHTKKCLSKKIEANYDKIEAGALLKALVLRTDSGELYLIDLFLNDKEYDEFLEFYKKEKQVLKK